MPVLRICIAIIAIALVAGCSARPKIVAENKNPPATRPTDISLTPTDQIDPRARLYELNPTPQPTTKPSLPELQIYEEDRELYQDRNAGKAVESLRRAVEIDKNS